MAGYSQRELEKRALAKQFDDKPRLEAALAALEGVKGKHAASERKFFQRRLDALAFRDEQREEHDALSPAEVADQIRGAR